jgi:hypothetical protein
MKDSTTIMEAKKGSIGILYRTIAPKFPAVNPIEKARNREKERQKTKRGYEKTRGKIPSTLFLYKRTRDQKSK